MLDEYLKPGAVLQLISAAVMIAAVIYAAIQARAAREAVRALVNQSLTDRMVDQVRFFADRPEVGKSVFSQYSDEPTDKIRAFMSVHPFLLHFESVLTMRRQLPKREFRYYLASMAQIFSEAPVLHEWMSRTWTVWSKELWQIATANQPKAVPAEQHQNKIRHQNREAHDMARADEGDRLFEEYSLIGEYHRQEDSIFWQRQTVYLAVNSALLAALALTSSADGNAIPRLIALVPTKTFLASAYSFGALVSLAWLVTTSTAGFRVLAMARIMAEIEDGAHLRTRLMNRLYFDGSRWRMLWRWVTSIRVWSLLIAAGFLGLWICFLTAALKR